MKRVAVVRFILHADARRLGATFDSWRRYVHRAKVMWRKGTMIRRRSDGYRKRRAFDRWVERAAQTKKVHRIAARAHRRGLADKSRETKQKVLLAWCMHTKQNKEIARVHRRAESHGCPHGRSVQRAPAALRQPRCCCCCCDMVVRELRLRFWLVALALGLRGCRRIDAVAHALRFRVQLQRRRRGELVWV